MESHAVPSDLGARDAEVPEFDDSDFDDVPGRQRPPEPFASAWAIALFGGGLAAVNGPAPTGHVATDIVLTGTAVAAVVWFCSVLPIRFAALTTLVAGCLSITWPGLVLGVVSYVAAAGNSIERPPPSWVNVALVALTMNLAARSELGWFFGASALIGMTIAALAVVRSIPRHRSHVRRRVGVLAVLCLIVTAVGAGALLRAGLQSRDDLRSGERTVRRGLDELVAGDVATAVASFEEAESSFDRAHARLTGPLVQISRAVPVAAQHRRAGVELTSQARGAARTLVRELGPVDLETLTFRDGRIDVDAIAALAEPLGAVRTDIAELRTTIASIDDPWLIGAVRERLDELQGDIAEQLDRSDQFVEVVDHVPSMLGRERARRYFVAFTTPSEVRGLGGFMGNWAEITIDDGAIELSRFGRSNELDAAAEPGERTVTGPPDWLARYGRFGFDNASGGVNTDAWKNITLSPSMRSTGQVITELYPQSGGREIDGVFALDVFAVAALLELTGPIDLPDGRGTVDADSAPQFLLKDQYDADDREDRIDVLEIVSNRVFETLLETRLPPPSELLDLMGPLVERGRIAGYAQNDGEQELLERSGIAGTLADPGDGDGLAITFNNAIGNKIDFFLRTSASYDVVADQESGRAEATLELQMENRSPAAGQPNYVIGNPLAEPLGTNRTIVSVYSRLPLVTATVDGEEVSVEQTVEAGYFVTGVVVELGSRETSTLRFELAGELDLADGYRLVSRTPPIANDLSLAIDARLSTDDGVEVAEREIRRPGSHDLSINAATN